MRRPDLARRLALLLLPASILATSLQAQDAPPTLAIERGGRTEHLRASKVDVRATVTGALAETVVTLTFHNGGAGMREGELYVPLPPGATVSGFALDVEGQMIDAVVVERTEARVVFEQIVRRGVDPGLVEWTRGNVFKTRIFPIPAGGSRTARVRWVSELGGESGATYRLPLTFREPIDEAHLRIEVADAGERPAVSGGPKGMRFEPWRSSWIAESSLRGAPLATDLLIELPAADSAPLVELGGHGDRYFCVPTVPDRVNDGTEIQPRRVTILWDASGSRARSSSELELELIRAYFAPIRGRVAVDVVPFALTLGQALHLTVEGGDTKALRAALAGIPSDGATRFAALPGTAADSAPDLYLLLSDGLSTLGKQTPGRFPAPVWAFSSSAEANTALLRSIAEGSGGAWSDLAADGAPVCARRIGRARPVLEIGHEPEGAVDLVHASTASAHERKLVCGRLLGAAARLSLTWTLAGERIGTVSVPLSAAQARRGDVVRTFWAERRLEALLAAPADNRAAILALGRQHGLVTPGTSLMVLDRVEQYIQFGIQPPSSRPDWREAYARARQWRKEQAVAREQQALGNVLFEWLDRQRLMRGEPPRPLFKSPPSGAGQERAPVRELGSTPATPGARARPAVPPPPALEAPARGAPGAVAPHRSGVEGGVVGGVAGGVEAGGDIDGVPAGAPTGDAPLRIRGTDQAATALGRQDEPARARISLQAWSPLDPAADALRAAPAGRLESTYLELRRERSASPGFYLDCADVMLDRGARALAIRVLSNLAEIDLENPALLRVLGHRLAQAGELRLATDVLERVLELRPEEPQSRRDLALVLARRGRLSRALELLAEVVMGDWPRFAGVELIALEELNALLPRARAAGARIPSLDARLIAPVEADLRVVISWDADATDIDLWVTEPSGEKAMYNNRRTRSGGLVSRDFTGGYGPEEYLIRRAAKGEYMIQAHYYGTRSNRTLGPVTLQAEIITSFGRPNEKRRLITLRLSDQDEVIDVGSVTF